MQHEHAIDTTVQQQLHQALKKVQEEPQKQKEFYLLMQDLNIWLEQKEEK